MSKPIETLFLSPPDKPATSLPPTGVSAQSSSPNTVIRDSTLYYRFWFAWYPLILAAKAKSSLGVLA